MAALVENTDFFIKQGLPNAGMKTLLVSCKNTVDSSDTLDVNLNTFGAGSVCGIIGFTHTTENSVVIQEQPTVTIASRVLTITIGGASNDQTRHYLIFCGPTKNQ